MNLLRKNIHMDVVKSQAISQITLEDDVNLSDSRPDMEKIILEDGTVRIEEVKTSGDHVLVRGRLFVDILYLSDDRDTLIAKMEGAIPFEEKIFMEGIQPGTHVDVTADVEDLSIGLINSRKVSVRAILTLYAKQQELMDEETAVELYTEEAIEYRKKQLDYTELSVCKKDIYRIRQEVDLPANLPNIFQIIWESVYISGLEWKAMEGQIAVQGELVVFFLYEGEGEERPIRFYEGTIPFSGVIEEKNSREMMITDITSQISNLLVEVKPDFDGEERVVSIEAVLDLDIKLYEETQMEILADVYGVTKEVTAVSKTGEMKHLLMKNDGKCRVSGKLKMHNGSKNMLQVLFGTALPIVEDVVVLEDAVQVNGHLQAKCLYVTNDDLMPYDSVSGKIPFEYMVDAKGVSGESDVKVKVSLEQLGTAVVAGEEVEVKAVLAVQIIAFEKKKQELIADVKVAELNLEQIKNLPQMVIYVAKEGDSLWQIGKQYYVSVADLKEINEISQDECRQGQKILVVR